MNVHNDKKFKKSSYNIEVKRLDNEKILLFNSLSTSICALRKEVYDNIQHLNIEKIKRLEGVETIDKLISNGFLVEEKLDEYKYYENMFLKNKFSNRSLGITVSVTLDCNMCCPYCFENKTDLYMNKETSDALVKFIKTQAKLLDIKHLKINWFGGEPLLNLDIIEYLSNILIEYCSENNIKYSGSMATNGVLLTKDVAQRLKEHNITNIEVTIDGLKEIHNKRRMLKNKQESYDIIFENIIQCSEILDITVRTNIDKENIKGIHSIIDELSINNINFYHTPVINTENENSTSEKFFTQEEFSRINIELAQHIYKNYENYKNYKNAIYPQLRIGPCQANKDNFFAIDPNGLLYKCSAFLSEPDKSIGNVFEGIISHSINTQWIGLDIPTKCKSCNKLPICGVGCPLEKMKNPKCEIECPDHSFNLKDRIDLYLNYN